MWVSHGVGVGSQPTPDKEELVVSFAELQNEKIRCDSGAGKCAREKLRFGNLSVFPE
jgi:hypothetical protein